MIDHLFKLAAYESSIALLLIFIIIIRNVIKYKFNHNPVTTIFFIPITLFVFFITLFTTNFFAELFFTFDYVKMFLFVTVSGMFVLLLHIRRKKYNFNSILLIGIIGPIWAGMLLFIAMLLGSSVAWV